MGARYSFYEDDAEQTFEISSTEVEACTDVLQLVEWYEGLEELAEDLRHQLQAVALSGLNDDAWVWKCCQKLGWTGRGKSRVARRLKSLGHIINPLGVENDRLRRELNVAKAEAAVAIHFLRLAQEQMVPAEYADLADAATQAVRADERKAVERKAYFAARGAA